MKKIKAYIVYAGHEGEYHAALVFENGWAAFNHVSSHPNAMLNDLWLSHPERQKDLSEMGYEVDVTSDPISAVGHSRICNDLIAELEDKHRNKSHWREMAEHFKRKHEHHHPNDDSFY